jgi:predicted site-specific integrase-resolvase
MIMQRKEAAEYVGISVERLDGYRNRCTLSSTALWSGGRFINYFDIKDLDRLKIQIQTRQAKRDLQNQALTLVSPVEDPLGSNLQEMVSRYCY